MILPIAVVSAAVLSVAALFVSRKAAAGSRGAGSVAGPAGGSRAGGAGAVSPPASRRNPESDSPAVTSPVEPVTQASADHPLSVPEPAQFYQVRRGDVGVRLVSAAYGTVAGSGAPLRIWNKLIKSDRNRALSPSGTAAWDGQLLARHRTPGQWHRGSGSSFPIVWFPPREEVGT